MDKIRTPQDCHNTSRPIAALATDMPHGHYAKAHHHAPAQLIHALSGVMSVKSPQGSWVVPSGRALWMPADTLHEIRVAGHVSMRTVFVKPGARDGLPTTCELIEVSPLLREAIVAATDIPGLLDLARRRAKVPFQGVLYAGLMLTAQGPKVLEFNARFGDPECEPLLLRMESSLLELLDATVDRTLETCQPPRWRDGAAVSVVMASEGYPGPVSKGQPIRGLEAAGRLPNVQVFHAATRQADGAVVADGGRVLAVTALGSSLARAKLQAYTAVKEIRWAGAWCRKDIGDKGLRRERELLAAEVASEEPAAS